MASYSLDGTVRKLTSTVVPPEERFPWGSKRLRGLLHSAALRRSQGSRTRPRGQRGCVGASAVAGTGPVKSGGNCLVSGSGGRARSRSIHAEVLVDGADGD